MFHFRHTPLAWKNLTHNVRRLMIAVSGVTFAVVLMFMERGFQNALFDSTVELVRNFRADIVMVSSSRYSLSSSSRFPLDCYFARAWLPAVSRKLIRSTSRTTWRCCGNRTLSAARSAWSASTSATGCSPTSWKRTLDGYRRQLQAPRTALIDVTSKAVDLSDQSAAGIGRSAGAGGAGGQAGHSWSATSISAPTSPTMARC